MSSTAFTRPQNDTGENVCLKSHCYWSEWVLVVDAEHHLMHISFEPTKSLASTTNFLFVCFLGQLPTLKTCGSLLDVMKDSPLVSVRDEGEISTPTRFQPVQLAPKEWRLLNTVGSNGLSWPKGQLGLGHSQSRLWTQECQQGMAPWYASWQRSIASKLWFFQ